MTDPAARSAPETGAGVLGLLRPFKNDQKAADEYAAACLEQAKAVEPRLKAFEYLPQNTARPAGFVVRHSGLQSGQAKAEHRIDWAPAEELESAGKKRVVRSKHHRRSDENCIGETRPGPLVRPRAFGCTAIVTRHLRQFLKYE
jgi:hypothetical protein